MDERMILRCEQNHAERVVTDSTFAALLITRCVCRGEHTLRVVAPPPHGYSGMLTEAQERQVHANRARYIAKQEREAESLVLNLISQGLDRDTAERRVSEFVASGGVVPRVPTRGLR